MTDLLSRVAGAPITWGVCEVSGWGFQMSVDRVLGEVSELGLTAIELGPPGFLPTDPPALRRSLGRFGLELVAGFVPLVLHDAARRTEELKQARSAATQLRAGGASVMVLAADTGVGNYEHSPELDRDGWKSLATGVAAVEELAFEQGLRVALHPHLGTMVESPDQVESLLEISSVGLCLDTGHLLAGGGDPVALAKSSPDRIIHSHLKDVDATTAERVRSGAESYYQAVKNGMYRPLGAGDVDVAAIVNALEGSGYRGWYVLEQDVVLEGDPPPRRGPIEAARDSYLFLQSLVAGKDSRLTRDGTAARPPRHEARRRK